MNWHSRYSGWGDWRYVHIIPSGGNFPGDGTKSTGKHRAARKARFKARHQ